MKKLFSLFLALMASISLWALDTDTDGYYLLGSTQDLKDFAALVNAGSVDINGKLTTDIDLAGEATNQWTPIGNSTNKFSGILDGQGYTIKNLYCTQKVTCIGFIGVANSTAIIKNVRVEGTVDNSSNGAGYGYNENNTIAGGIVAALEGATVINCSFSGSVVTWCHGGGIAGFGNGTIINCYNEGNIIFYSRSGQASGGIHGGGIGTAPQVINCYNIGSIINNGDKANAIGSISCTGAISDCYSRENCCRDGASAGWTNSGNYGTAMSLSDMKTADFVATLNTNVAALKTTYSEISEWEQDPVSCLPILKVFVHPSTPTAIDNTSISTKATKRIVNGQLLIEKNGVRYNSLGQQIK